MECKIKGSYTIEMAMISGVWLLILFASLLLLLGSYERVWDTAGACETAVYGSTMAVVRKTDGVQKARILFASLLLLLGSYERVWDTAGACETAVYGSTMAVVRKTDGVQKARETSGVRENAYTVSGSKREITVSFDKKLKLPFQNLSWRRKAVVKSKVIRS